MREDAGKSFIRLLPRQQWQRAAFPVRVPLFLMYSPLSCFFQEVRNFLQNQLIGLNGASVGLSFQSLISVPALVYNVAFGSQ